MTDGSGSALLIVCTANVCRSPLVESVLRRRLPRTAGPLAALSIGSAGARALPDQAMCPVSAEASGDDAFAAAHRSRPLDAALIAGAGLVLTAEREHRGAVARLLPGSQSRVFTLLEAEALAGIALRRVQDGDVDRPDDLTALAALLHACRGRIPLAEPPRPTRGLLRRRDRTPPADPLDLVDGHGRPIGEHAAAVARTHALADRLATALDELTAATPRAA